MRSNYDFTAGSVSDSVARIPIGWSDPISDSSTWDTIVFFPRDMFDIYVAREIKIQEKLKLQFFL
jgi:hypothetical protein